MTDKKYEFTGETKEWEERTLRRIRRISDGTIGGWIQGKHNLCNDPRTLSWVADEAIACDEAMVIENARMFDNSIAQDNTVLCGYAKMQHNSWMRERACIKENASMRDFAQMRDCSLLGGHTFLSEMDCLDKEMIATFPPIFLKTCVNDVTICDNLTRFLGGKYLKNEEVETYFDSLEKAAAMLKPFGKSVLSFDDQLQLQIKDVLIALVRFQMEKLSKFGQKGSEE